MKFTGKLQNVSRDWSTGQYHITFTVNEPTVLNQVSSLKDIEILDVEAKKHRKKRSLDANAYCWVLMSKIAETIGSSKEEVYEELLQSYGYIYEDEDGYISVTVRAGVDMSKVEGHWKLFKESKDGRFKSYLMIRGSSEYDTSEMARFIDMVVLEAKELGIETLPPDELERMKVAWK